MLDIKPKGLKLTQIGSKPKYFRDKFIIYCSSWSQQRSYSLLHCTPTVMHPSSHLFSHHRLILDKTRPLDVWQPVRKTVRLVIYLSFFERVNFRKSVGLQLFLDKLMCMAKIIIIFCVRMPCVPTVATIPKSPLMTVLPAVSATIQVSRTDCTLWLATDHEWSNADK